MNAPSNLSRRDMLRLVGAGALGAVAGGVFGVRPAPALAQSAAPKPLGFFSFNVGAMEVTVIRDAARPVEAAIFGTTAPEGGVAQLLKDNGVPGSQFVNTFNVLLVKNGEKLALFDTGNGATAGSLLATLAALGIAQDTITDVVISHNHGDHTNGALVNGALTFPKAMYHYPEAEKAFIDGAAESAGVNTNRAIIKTAGDATQLDIYKAETEILPGVMTMATPGHTPGHTSFMFQSDNASLMVTVDAILNSVISTAHPEWHAQFDGDKAMAVDTRKRLLADAAAKGTRILAYHFPFPGTGYIDTDSDGYRFVPVM